MAELKILIADDHELIRRGVRNLLATRSEWRLVGEACDGADAVQKATRLRPDIAILDYSMPVMNGPTAAALIAEQVPEIGVIVLTMHDSEQVIREVLKAGARGMVLKSDADRNLLDAVEAVAAKRHFFTPRVSEILLSEYLREKPVLLPTVRGEAALLTPREREILLLLADGGTSKAIAARLEISVRTIESHRNNINRKLGFASIADLVRYAIRHGIVAQT